jgi:hypothetical protein
MMTRKQMASTWGASRPPHVLASTRRSRRWTTSRDSSRGACLNHVYPINHNLKDYDTMNNFMTSGSLTRDKETEEDQGGSDAMPFLGKMRS